MKCTAPSEPDAARRFPIPASRRTYKYFTGRIKRHFNVTDICFSGVIEARESNITNKAAHFQERAIKEYTFVAIP